MSSSVSETLGLYSHMITPQTLPFIKVLGDLWDRRRYLEGEKIYYESWKEKHIIHMEMISEKFEKGEIKNLHDKMPGKADEDIPSYLEDFKYHMGEVGTYNKMMDTMDKLIEETLNKISSLENSINSLMIKKNIHPFFKV